MRIAERMTRWATETGVQVALSLNGSPVTASLTPGQWVHDTRGAHGSVTFGPFSTAVRADGVTVTVDDAVDRVMFGSELALPPGQTYKYQLTLSVTGSD